MQHIKTPPGQVAASNSHCESYDQNDCVSVSAYSLFLFPQNHYIYYPSSLALITWLWNFQTLHLDLVICVSWSCRNATRSTIRSHVELIATHSQSVVHYSAVDLDVVLQNTVFNNYSVKRYVVCVCISVYFETGKKLRKHFLVKETSGNESVHSDFGTLLQWSKLMVAVQELDKFKWKLTEKI